MSTGFGQQHRQTQQAEQRQEIVARQITEQRQQQLAEAELDDELELDNDEVVEADEDTEPLEEETPGDSDRILGDDPSVIPFDREVTSELPFLGDLPSRARPPVRYRIDENHEVHRLDRGQYELSDVRDAIAGGIARHLRDHKCRLEEPGDWCQVPYIDMDTLRRLAVPDDDREIMTELVGLRRERRPARRAQADPEIDRRIERLRDKLSDAARRLDNALDKYGRAVRSFAVMLPNGDVVSLDALAGQRPWAREGLKATRAAALRLAEEKPGQLAGEAWTENDWRNFQRVQNQARNRTREREERRQNLQPGD